jgi:hypothetical protein
MSSPAKSVGRAGLAALLALGLSAAEVPALAEKGGGKPDWAGHKPDGKHGRPDRAGHGSPAHSTNLGPTGGARGVDARSVLAAGATAAMVSALLGGQTQNLTVGARPLPPGIQKNLARGKPLPPGISKQTVPQPVLVRLPVVDSHDWIRIGTELVLVGIATSVIAQVIHNVFG